MAKLHGAVAQAHKLGNFRQGFSVVIPHDDDVHHLLGKGTKGRGQLGQGLGIQQVLIQLGSVRKVFVQLRGGLCTPEMVDDDITGDGKNPGIQGCFLRIKIIQLFDDPFEAL